MAPSHNVVLWPLLLHFAQSQVLTHIGRMYFPDSKIPGAENSAIDYDTDRVFSADGYHKSVNSFEFILDDNLTSAETIPSVNILIEPAFAELGLDPVELEDITCVAMSYAKGYILATVVPTNYTYLNGWLAFIDPRNQTVFHLLEMPECYLPDHVTMTADGSVILVSCEAEPADNEDPYSNNPRGSVGYVDVSSANMSSWTFTNVGFEDFDYGNDKFYLLPEDIYIPLPADISDDEGRFSLTAEPEHIVVDNADRFAYVSLQENNCVAVLDIAAKEIIRVFSLGTHDFGTLFGLDASDKDGGINIRTYENLRAMRQPDDIDFIEMPSGRQFLFTANEGDDKGFDVDRVKHLDLDVNFGNESEIEELQSNEVLGRLKVSTLIGMTNDTNGTDDADDAFFETLYTFSSRDFTVFEILRDADGVPMNLTLHYSSNDNSPFEEILKETMPEAFNYDYVSDSFDERSDAKGPEPEGITVGECENGRMFVFICLERVGGVMVYDFTDIDDIIFVDYANPRNFSYMGYTNDSVRPAEAAGDIGPEQMRFVPGEVYGEPLLVMSHPQSASVAMYKVDCGEAPDLTSTTQSMETTESGGGKGEKEDGGGALETLEIVAVAVGALVVLALIALGLFYRQKANKGEMHRYLSTRNDEAGADYVEMET